MGHEFVDILKMDIDDGQEWSVIKEMLDTGLLGTPRIVPHKLASAGCSKIGAILSGLHFQKRSPMPTKVAIEIIGQARIAGFEVYSRKENWRSGERMKYNGIEAWNSMEVGMVLPKKFRCHPTGGPMVAAPRPAGPQ